MGAVSPVAAYQPTNCTTQNGSDYKNTLDGNSLVAQRFATRFAPHAANPANMTAVLDPGSMWNGVNLKEVAAQTTAAFVAPVNYPRIDRVVIDAITGALQVVAGMEATAPVPPAIPNGTYPVAQVRLTVGMAAVTNTIIMDERNFSSSAGAAFGAQTSIGSAATVDLGTVLTRNALITGMTSISAFGSSANTASPIYLIEFAASLTLHNGPSLALPGGADIVTSNNDTGVAEYLGSGNWRIRDFTRAGGHLGTAAAFDVGTAAGNIVQLDQADKLPAVDGSQLLNLPSSSVQLNAAYLTAAGNFLTPNGTTANTVFKFTLQAGGGGGGGGANSAYGGGGGAGGQVVYFASGFAAQTSLAVAIGAGGSAGNSNNAGGAGGTTSITLANGVSVSATGGRGGAFAATGQGAGGGGGSGSSTGSPPGVLIVNSGHPGITSTPGVGTIGGGSGGGGANGNGNTGSPGRVLIEWMQ